MEAVGEREAPQRVLGIACKHGFKAAARFLDRQVGIIEVAEHEFGAAEFASAMPTRSPRSHFQGRRC